MAARLLDAKRGAEAMERAGLIPRCHGKLVHDCLGAYETFGNCEHFYCNAHLQRELIYLHEQMDQAWAGDMIELLPEAKKLSDRERIRWLIGGKTPDDILKRYTEILLEGFAVNPEPPPAPPGKPGRKKRSKALNLLIRLDNRPVEIIGFCEHREVPYNNNQAERNLRMMKVREKIGGTYRSADHGRAYCDLRGIISSAREQSRAMLDTLKRLVTAPETHGADLAAAQET